MIGVAAVDPFGGVGGKIEIDLGILCCFQLGERLCRFDSFIIINLLLFPKLINNVLASICLPSVNRLILPYSNQQSAHTGVYLILLLLLFSIQFV